MERFKKVSFSDDPSLVQIILEQMVPAKEGGISFPGINIEIHSPLPVFCRDIVHGIHVPVVRVVCPHPLDPLQDPVVLTVLFVGRQIQIASAVSEACPVSRGLVFAVRFPLFSAAALPVDLLPEFGVLGFLVFFQVFPCLCVRLPTAAHQIEFPVENRVQMFRIFGKCLVPQFLRKFRFAQVQKTERPVVEAPRGRGGFHGIRLRVLLTGHFPVRFFENVFSFGKADRFFRQAPCEQRFYRRRDGAAAVAKIGPAILFGFRTFFPQPSACIHLRYGQGPGVHIHPRSSSRAVRLLLRAVFRCASGGTRCFLYFILCIIL